MRFLAIVLCTVCLGFSAIAQKCDPTAQSHAVRIGPNADEPIEVFGDTEYFQRLENGWVFALLRTELGWSVRVYDSEPVSDGVDLTAFTPPLRGAPNPRDVEGWHFRNADNSGPNKGDVNAPQMLRGFIVSPSLAGTGGLRPPKGSIEPSPQDGIGWLKINDLGFDNSAIGDKARLNYLKAEGCLSWPRSIEETNAFSDMSSLEYDPQDLETFGACGLPLDSYTLSASILPRQFGGDIDGDGALDEVAQIVRSSDNRRGLALCRAGTWLSLIDMEEGSVPGLRSGIAQQTEAWQWISQADALPRHLSGYEMPDADGDYLILERIEKEAFVLFWKDQILQAKRMYGYVEP